MNYEKVEKFEYEKDKETMKTTFKINGKEIDGKHIYKLVLTFEGGEKPQIELTTRDAGLIPAK